MLPTAFSHSLRASLPAVFASTTVYSMNSREKLTSKNTGSIRRVDWRRTCSFARTPRCRPGWLRRLRVTCGNRYSNSGRVLRFSGTLVLVIDVALSLVVSTVLFAFVYKYVPQERSDWGDVWVGGLVTAVLFNIGKFAIGFFLGKSAFASVYGTAGSLLVFLLWAYYSAQIFLIGAEFTKSYSFVLGTRVPPPAQPSPK